jgi:uncharacterized repeat protein (TIGR03803 family)
MLCESGETNNGLYSVSEELKTYQKEHFAMKSIRIARVLQHIAVASTLVAPIAANCQTTAAAHPQETTLYAFTGSGLDGFQPVGPLVAQTSPFTGQVEAVYGVTGGGGSQAGTCGGDFGCGTIYKLSRPASATAPWNETLLFTNFMQANGAIPGGGLFMQPTPLGPLFAGTTLFGGAGSTSDSSFTGNGTVYGLVGDQLFTRWDFSGGTDQQSPSGALIADDAAGIPGALYGTTRGGHSPSEGTVFRVEPLLGRLTTIWTFSTTDGKRPVSALLADGTGALYGMTYEGGANGIGTVFKLTPPHYGQTTWTLQTLWSFTGAKDGSNPDQADSLIMDASGALYGTSFTGGSTNAFCGTTGCGVVFKLTPPAHGTAWTEQTLWTFTGGNDGAYPLSGVIMDRTGALYGMTNGGGNTGCDDFQAFDTGCGVAFKLTPPAAGHSAWTQTTLHLFGATASDGTNPLGALIADSTGTLYGVAAAGGPAADFDSGTVFELTGTGYLP